MPKKRFGVDLEHTNYEQLYEMDEKDIVATLKKRITRYTDKSDEHVKQEIKKFLLYDKIKNQKNGPKLSEEERKAARELFKESKTVATNIKLGLDSLIEENNVRKVIAAAGKTIKNYQELGKAFDKKYGNKNNGDQNEADAKEIDAELEQLDKENKEEKKKAEAFDKKKGDISKKAKSISSNLNISADMDLLNQVLYTVENADKDDKGVDEYLDAIAKGLTEVDKNLKNEAALHKNMISLSTTTKEYNKAQIPSEWEFYEAPKAEIKNDDVKKEKDKHKLKVEVSNKEKDERPFYQRLFAKKKKPTVEDLMTEVNTIEHTDVLDREPRKPGTMDQLLTQLKNNKKKSLEEKKKEVEVKPVEKVEKKEEKKNMGENTDNNQNNNNKTTEVEQNNVQVGANGNNTENKNENNSSVEKPGKNVGQDPAKNGTDVKPNPNNSEAEKNVDTGKKIENEIKPANSDDNKKIEIKNNQEGQELEQAKEEKTESEKTAPKDESKNENNNVPDNKDKEDLSNKNNSEVSVGQNPPQKDIESKPEQTNNVNNKDKDKVENEQVNSQNKEQNKEIKNNVNVVEQDRQIKTDEEKNLEKGKNNESEAGKKESDNKDIEKNVDGNNNPEKIENNSKVENVEDANKKVEESKEQKNEVPKPNLEKNENNQNNKEVEKPQPEKTEKDVDGNNNPDSLNKDEQRIVLVNSNVANLKPKNVNNSQVVDPILAEAEAKDTNINQLAENIVNGGQPPLVEAKKANLKIANEAKIEIDPVKLHKALSGYEKSLNEHVSNSQVVKDSNLLRKSSKCNEADEAELNRSFNTLQEDEAEVRKYIPAKADNINISVPDLIKNQMRLEAGQMRPDEKKDHFENIIKMKGVDGDKYAKELVDYRLKVAEEAGREFEKKHQDPTKLSFLNKSANAIETIMCAMTRNPLGIMMMLAAAVYAPLLMVGLLAFTAWKRKRPNPAYQNAWQEQNRREMEAKRQQLATSYGCEASQISDREVKDALKQDYVQEKIIESMQAKLERDARKVVDSAAKDYAKAISKESGTKYSAKDLKDIAQKDLMRKDPRYGSNAATLSTQREDNLRQHIKNHEKKRKESGMGGRSM